MNSKQQSDKNVKITFPVHPKTLMIKKEKNYKAFSIICKQKKNNGDCKHFYTTCKQKGNGHVIHGTHCFNDLVGWYVAVFMELRDDKYMTSMNIAQYLRPPALSVHLRANFSSPLILGIQFQLNSLPFAKF